MVYALTDAYRQIKEGLIMYQRKWYVIRWAYSLAATKYTAVSEHYLASSAKEIADKLNSELEPDPYPAKDNDGEWTWRHRQRKQYFVSCIHPDDASPEDYEHFER